MSVNLPEGHPLKWDMTTLTDAQLTQEHRVAFEALYGSTLQGKPVPGLPGLLTDKYKADLEGGGHPMLEMAIKTWQKRLSRAEEEAERRFLT